MENKYLVTKDYVPGTAVRLRQGWEGGTIKATVLPDGTLRHESDFSPLYEVGDLVTADYEILAEW